MPQRAPVAKLPRFGSETANRDRQRRRRHDGLLRLYDSSQWRTRTRPHVLHRDPYCKIGFVCGGKEPSTDVDHVIPAEIYVERHGGDQRYFYDETNLRGVCEADHSRKTLLEQRGEWKELTPPAGGIGGSAAGGRAAGDHAQGTHIPPQQKIFSGGKL